MSVQVYDKNGQPYEADLIDGIKYRELEKLLAAAKQDTKRIDWLENQGQLIARQYRDGWHFDASNGAWVCVNATSLREAIDHAREGTK